MLHEDHITIDPTDLEQAKAFLRERFADFIESDTRIGAAIEAAERLFPWPMADARARDWSKGRVLLCGDAAVGFMPTAGAGANTAMRSLADELSRVNGEIAPLAAEMFEKRCREIVEKNQHDSRNLAKYIFVDNRTVAWGRDLDKWPDPRNRSFIMGRQGAGMNSVRGDSAYVSAVGT